MSQKTVQRNDKTNSQKSSDVAKNCPTKRQNQFLKVVRCCKKLSNKTTKPILKSRPMLHKTVQRNDKINSQKSSDVAKTVQRSDKPIFKKSFDVAKNCPMKRQNQFSKVVRCRKKLSNETTKPILKSHSMSYKTVQRSNKINSQKLSKNAEIIS